MSVTNQPADLSVELPAGGTLHLQTAEEVDLWTQSLRRYREDYVLVRINDQFTLGALLQNQILLFRAQTAINGMVPELDANDVPTGRYRRTDLDGAQILAYQKSMLQASQEMRALEKTLGIDKVTREAGGSHTLDHYIATLKKAAHVRGIHISKRTLAYEQTINELKWKLRMLYTADAEDRAYHHITPRTILDWLRGEVTKLEQMDIDFANEHGKLYVGKL